MPETSANVPVLHEDLGDDLAMVNYRKTLYTSTVKAGKPATASKYGQPADKPVEGRLGGKAEGRSIDRSKTANRHLNRKKIEGVVQEKVEDYGVSDRAQKVEDPAGINDLVGDSYMRCLEAFKDGLELTNLSQQVQNEAAYVRNEKDVFETQHLTQGASAWIDASPLGDITVDAAFRPSSDLNVEVTDLADFDEDAMRTLMMKKSDLLNDDCDSLVFCTSDFQLHMDGLLDEKAIDAGKVHLRSFNYQGGKDMFEVGLKGYKTSFGRLTLNHTRSLNAVRRASVDADGVYTALTGATTNTSTTVTVSSVRGLQPFMRIKGTNIPAGAYIVSITDATHIVISAAATGTASGTTLTLGRLDHALFLEMKYFEKKVNGKLEDVDLTPDQSGQQGYVQGFWSNFCGLPYVQAKVYSL